MDSGIACSTQVESTELERLSARLAQAREHLNQAACHLDRIAGSVPTANCDKGSPPRQASQIGNLHEDGDILVDMAKGIEQRLRRI